MFTASVVPTYFSLGPHVKGIATSAFTERAKRKNARHDGIGLGVYHRNLAGSRTIKNL